MKSIMPENLLIEKHLLSEISELGPFWCEQTKLPALQRAETCLSLTCVFLSVHQNPRATVQLRAPRYCWHTVPPAGLLVTFIPSFWNKNTMSETH